MLFGIISTIIVVSSLLNVNVFAQKNTNEGIKTPNAITIVSANADGTPTLVKSTEPLSTEQKLELLNRNGGQKVQIESKIPSDKQTKNFIVYTYSNAPADVKANYEANCKATNIKPSPSDEIFVPIK